MIEKQRWTGPLNGVKPPETDVSWATLLNSHCTYSAIDSKRVSSNPAFTSIGNSNYLHQTNRHSLSTPSSIQPSRAHSLSQGSTTSDSKHLPIHPPRILTAQKSHDARYILRHPNTVQRRPACRKLDTHVVSTILACADMDIEKSGIPRQSACRSWRPHSECISSPPRCTCPF